MATTSTSVAAADAGCGAAHPFLHLACQSEVPSRLVLAACSVWALRCASNHLLYYYHAVHAARPNATTVTDRA